MCLLDHLADTCAVFLCIFVCLVGSSAKGWGAFTVNIAASVYLEWLQRLGWERCSYFRSSDY